MPLIAPTAVAHLDMLVNGYYPDCDYLNAHAVDIAAGPDAVWGAIPLALAAAAASPAIAWPLVFAAFVRREGLHRPRRPAPPALREGAEFGPWRVDRAVPQREVVFAGSHRYARYVAGFYLDPLAAGGTRLYQVTRADFPGLAARLYLLGVKLFHDPIVESVLNRVRRLAEAAGS